MAVADRRRSCFNFLPLKSGSPTRSVTTDAVPRCLRRRFNFLPLKSGSPTCIDAGRTMHDALQRFNFLPLKSGSPTHLTHERGCQRSASSCFNFLPLKSGSPTGSRRVATHAWCYCCFNFLPLKSGSPTLAVWPAHAAAAADDVSISCLLRAEVPHAARSGSTDAS